MDSWALEYLLACTASKLKHLTIELREVDFMDGSLGKLLGWTRAGPSLRRLLVEQLEQLPTQLPPLSSLVLVISDPLTDMKDEFAHLIRFAITILEHIKRDHLTDVRVEFTADPLANLGACISGASPSLEACKRLDEALLTFPNVAVLVHDPMHKRRAGRAKLWSPIIRRAFPRLDERGLLTLSFTPCEWKLVSH